MQDKRTLKQKYEELSDKYIQLEKDYNELHNHVDEEFSASALFRSMQREIEFFKTAEKFDKELYEQAKALSQQMEDKYKTIYEDNKAFMKSAGGSYWVGMTREHDVEALENEISRLNGKLEAKDQVIKYLKSIISEQLYGKENSCNASVEEFVPKPAKRGKKKSIDKATEQRVQKLRENGHSVRAIAAIENISVGSVQAILKPKTKD